MRLPRLEIQSQFGLLNVRSQHARLEGGPAKRELSMRGNNGVAVHIETTYPEIRIDQTRLRESIGIDTPLTNMDKFYMKAKQKVLDRIGGIVKEGLAIMKIENGGGGGGEAMARIGARKLDKHVQLTLGWIVPPEIDAVMGTIEVTNATEEVRTDWPEVPKTRQYIPGSVSITAWAVEPSLDIRVVPGTEKIPVSYGIGLYLDRAV
jgi:hypothetical protein